MKKIKIDNGHVIVRSKRLSNGQMIDDSLTIRFGQPVAAEAATSIGCEDDAGSPALLVVAFVLVFLGGLFVLFLLMAMTFDTRVSNAYPTRGGGPAAGFPGFAIRVGCAADFSLPLVRAGGVVPAVCGLVLSAQHTELDRVASGAGAPGGLHDPRALPRRCSVERAHVVEALEGATVPGFYLHGRFESAPLANARCMVSRESREQGFASPHETQRGPADAILPSWPAHLSPLGDPQGTARWAGDPAAFRSMTHEDPVRRQRSRRGTRRRAERAPWGSPSLRSNPKEPT